MPWTAAGASKHTKKASSPRLRALWAHTANKALKSGGSDASAIRRANAVIARVKKGDKS